MEAVFQKIRPAFVLPSRFKVSNSLLNEEFVNVAAEVNEQIANAPILCLQTDAWSNCRNDSISNYMINTPESVFYKTTHTQENRHTSQFSEKEMKEVIDELKSS